MTTDLKRARPVRTSIIRARAIKAFGAALMAALALAICNRAHAASTVNFCATIWDKTVSGEFEDASFPGPYAVVTGLVSNRLDSDGLPKYIGPGGCTNLASGWITNNASFKTWWSDTHCASGNPNLIATTNIMITLAETTATSGVFAYTNLAFFPIDNEFCGNTPGESHNFGFAMHIHNTISFATANDYLFFGGDDDVWVFVNGMLVIDLGSIHALATATTTGTQLEGLGLVAGQQYPLDIFYCERHPTGSDFECATSFKLFPVQIACPTNVVVRLSEGCAASNVNLGAVTANVNCFSAAHVTSNAPSSFPLGTNYVTWTADDGGGNTNTCVQSVVVLDVTPPNLACPPDVTVNANANFCYATGVNLGLPVASATCGGAIATITSNAPPQFPVGATLVTWTATDTSGNANSCVQRVNVVDAQPPTLTPPGDLSAVCSVSEQPAYPNYAAFVTAGGQATDNCGINTASFALVSETSNHGQPEIVTRAYEIADVNGNYTTNTQRVVISHPAPALAITGFCPETAPSPGQLMVFTGTVTNTGSVALTNVVINDTPPLNGFALTWASAPGTHYLVQGTFSLQAPVNWVNVSASLEALDTQTTYDLPLTGTAPWQFFRVVDQAGSPGNVVPFSITTTVLQPSAPVAMITQLQAGAGTSFTGQFVTPTNVCSITDVLSANAVSLCGSGISVSVTQTCAVATSPNVSITVLGPASPPSPGQNVMFTGTVSNGGNVALTNVTIINNQPANNTPVATFAVLEADRAAVFNGSFPAPPNTCAVTSALTVAGTSVCGVSVNNSVTQTWQIATSPALALTRSCPAIAPAPGQSVIYAGTVTNTGNITLTNIVIVDSQPTANSSVMTIAALAPGQGTNFSGSYTAPLNACSASDVLTATATSVCGISVANTATETCPLASTPALAITRSCPAIAPAPGQPLVYNGTVTNTGNITLTNVVIVDSQPTANTPVIAIASLDPGQGTNFSGSYTAPLDAVSSSDTLTATATSICGMSITNTAPQTCPLAAIPSLAVFKSCPAIAPAPGQSLVFGGMVTNTGDVDLTNVVVLDNQPSNNTPVTVISLLAVGQSANFNGSYVTPANVCAVTDTLTATGTSLAGLTATNTATAICPLATTPALALTRSCPATAPAPGQPLVYSGTVTNTGNITLTNIAIVDNQPAGNTPVLAVAVLNPGQGTNFSGSYTAPLDACSSSDTLTATATSICGTGVTNTAAETCPLATTPAFALTRNCPATAPTPGQPLVYSGTVTNTGNITLQNIVIVDNQPATGTPVMTIASLDPGQGTNFTGSYTAPLSACSSSDTLTVTATSVCGISVTNTAAETCPVAFTGAPALVVTGSCPASPAAPGQLVAYTGTVTNTGNITLTNVLIVNNLPANQTPVVMIALLNPGQGTNFSGSYTATLDACSSSDTLTATATSVCGTGVTNSATQVCPLTTTPALALTRNCPASPPAPGQPLVYTATVTNTGNITLTNIVVRDNQSSGNLLVFGKIWLNNPVPTNAAVFPSGPEDADFTSPAINYQSISNAANGYTVGTFLSNATISNTSSNWTAQGGTNATVDNTFVYITGQSYINAGSNSFVVAHDDGVVLTFPALGGVVVNEPGPTPESFTPFNVSAPTNGLYTFTLQYIECCGPPADLIFTINGQTVANSPVVCSIPALDPGQGVSFTNEYTAPLAGCNSSDTLTATAISVCGTSVTNTATETCPVACSGQTTLGTSAQAMLAPADGSDAAASASNSTNPPVDVNVEGGNARIIWLALAGQRYVVQAAVTPDHFTDISTPIAGPAVGRSGASFVDLGGATNQPFRNYRVRLLGPEGAR